LLCRFGYHITLRGRIVFIGETIVWVRRHRGKQDEAPGHARPRPDQGEQAFRAMREGGRKLIAAGKG
jgi:hypothetical protein